MSSTTLFFMTFLFEIIYSPKIMFKILIHWNKKFELFKQIRI